MEKILSLSIAAYNAEKDIVNCLDSLIRSNVLEKLDIIVGKLQIQVEFFL